MLILITGASSGLGAEMARQFAALGHDLVLTARRVERLLLLRAEILAKHPGVRVDVDALDVTDHDEVFRVFDAYAPVDRVIVNAGLGGAKIVGTGGHERNRAIVATNLLGALNQIEAAMQQFREQGRGHLVLMSSITAVRGLRGSPAVYAATKRALAHLAEGLRSEMLHAGLPIRITTVYAGYIESEMTADLTDAPFRVDTETGVRAIVAGIEAGKDSFFAPRLPWAPFAAGLRVLPLPLVAKITRPGRGE